MGKEEGKIKYYVLKKKAVPEVLLKVVEAKRLLASEKVMTIQEATEKTGISRSSFYKYKDDIFPFHENEKGRTITLVIQVDDTPGILSDILKEIAEFKANILTIHQSIPINGIATVTLSLEVLAYTGNLSDMIQDLEDNDGIHYLKIVGRE
ncbi:MAG: ACT domain-containing protein [Eubacteriales bacterium]